MNFLQLNFTTQTEAKGSWRRKNVNYFRFHLLRPGKMFKSAELPWLITFFQMFYNDKPVDWLLEHLIYTKVCNWEKDMVSHA